MLVPKLKEVVANPHCMWSHTVIASFSSTLADNSLMMLHPVGLAVTGFLSLDQ
jgi:hypothetical protein